MTKFQNRTEQVIGEARIARHSNSARRSPTSNWGQNFEVLVKATKNDKYLVVRCNECSKFYEQQKAVVDVWVRDGCRTRKKADSETHLKSELHLRMLRKTAKTPDEGIRSEKKARCFHGLQLPSLYTAHTACCSAPTWPDGSSCRKGYRKGD